MHKKDELKDKVRELRERYTTELGRFNYYKNCLYHAKEAVRQRGFPYEDEYVGQEEAFKKAISEYKSYKFVVKCEAEGLRALKYAIRELDRQMRSNNI